MNAPLKVTYGEVEIIYDESSDKWTFELRGRCRSMESLAKAKEFIDRPVKDDSEKKFEPVKCWLKRYGDGFKTVTVTSVADCDYRKRVWTVDEHKRRSLETVDNLYPCGVENDALVASWTELQTQITERRARQTALITKMQGLKL